MTYGVGRKFENGEVEKDGDFDGFRVVKEEFRG
jgi:hypothetical protein